MRFAAKISPYPPPITPTPINAARMNSDKLEKLTGVCAPVPSDAPSIRDEKSNTSQSQISTAIAINNKVPKNNSKIIPQTFVIQRRPNLFALDIFFGRQNRFTLPIIVSFLFSAILYFPAALSGLRREG